MRPSRICGFSGRQIAISELRSRCNEKDGSRGAVLLVQTQYYFAFLALYSVSAFAS